MLKVCFAGVCCSVFEAPLKKFVDTPLVLAALKRLPLAFGVSSAPSLPCWLKPNMLVLGVSLVLSLVNMPWVIVLALFASKAGKTLPPGVVGLCSGNEVEAPNRPAPEPFCCKLLKSDLVLAFGVSSGLLVLYSEPRLPPLNRLLLDFGVSVVKRLVLGLGVSAVDAKNDDFSAGFCEPKPPNDGVAGALSPFGC